MNTDKKDCRKGDGSSKLIDYPTVISSTSGELNKDDFSERRPETTKALIIDGVQLWIPPGALAMCSPVFATLFYDERYKEKDQEYIHLVDDDLSEMIEFLRCIIPRPVLNVPNAANAHMILNIVEKYQIYHIRKQCINILVDIWSKDEDRCVAAFKIGLVHSLEPLVNASLASVLKKDDLFDDPFFRKHVPDKLLACMWKFRSQPNSFNPLAADNVSKSTIMFGQLYGIRVPFDQGGRDGGQIRCDICRMSYHANKLNVMSCICNEKRCSSCRKQQNTKPCLCRKIGTKENNVNWFSAL